MLAYKLCFTAVYSKFLYVFIFCVCVGYYFEIRLHVFILCLCATLFCSCETTDAAVEFFAGQTCNRETMQQINLNLLTVCANCLAIWPIYSDVQPVSQKLCN